jgi:hypothetical protein
MPATISQTSPEPISSSNGVRACVSMAVTSAEAAWVETFVISKWVGRGAVYFLAPYFCAVSSMAALLRCISHSSILLAFLASIAMVISLMAISICVFIMGSFA